MTIGARELLDRFGGNAVEVTKAWICRQLSQNEEPYAAEVAGDRAVQEAARTQLLLIINSGVDIFSDSYREQCEQYRASKSGT